MRLSLEIWTLCAVNFSFLGRYDPGALFPRCHINAVAVHWYQLHSTSSLRLCRHKEVNYV